MKTFNLILCLLIGLLVYSCKKENTAKITEENLNGTWNDSVYAKLKMPLGGSSCPFTFSTSSVTIGILGLYMRIGNYKIENDSIFIFTEDLKTPEYRLKMSDSKTLITGKTADYSGINLVKQ